MSLSSFGFKYGPPLDAEWVIDARMVRNPFWVPDLRPLTGLDDPVRDYVLEDPVARGAHRPDPRPPHLVGRHYAERGRKFLDVAAGCTGGRHRSVVIVEALSPPSR